MFQFVHLQRLGFWILGYEFFQPFLLIVGGLLCAFGYCCLLCLLELFVVFDDLGLTVIHGFDFQLMGLYFSISALDSGPAYAFGNEEKSKKPAVVFSNCFSINFLHWIYQKVHLSRSLLILYSFSTVSEDSLLSS